MLDYIVAFGVFALAGIFKKLENRQNYAMLYGVIFCSVLRYLCHVISGATVWAGLSIPDSAALLYSLSYNATYMVPDTLILALVSGYVASVIDFRRQTPTRAISEKLSPLDATLLSLGGASLLFAFIFDSVAVFTKLQSESGEFDVTLLSEVNWLVVALVTLASALVSAALFLAVRFRGGKSGGK
jgi:thiamine transporter